MNKTETELIQVKRTKFVKMFYDEEEGELRIYTLDNYGVISGEIVVPIIKVPQIIRGLLSSYQRFYKKGYVKKKNTKVS